MKILVKTVVEVSREKLAAVHDVIREYVDFDLGVGISIRRFGSWVEVDIRNSEVVEQLLGLFGMIVRVAFCAKKRNMKLIVSVN